MERLPIGAIDEPSPRRPSIAITLNAIVVCVIAALVVAAIVAHEARAATTLMCAMFGQ